MGELAEWVDKHPEYLERILNWLLLGLNESKLANEAANSLMNICSLCQNHMTPHFAGTIGQCSLATTPVQEIIFSRLLSRFDSHPEISGHFQPEGEICGRSAQRSVRDPDQHALRPDQRRHEDALLAASELLKKAIQDFCRMFHIFCFPRWRP